MEVSGQFHAPAAFTLGGKTPGTHWVGGWLVPEPVKREVPCPYRESNPGRPARGLITMHWLRYPGSSRNIIFTIYYIRYLPGIYRRLHNLPSEINSSK